MHGKECLDYHTGILTKSSIIICTIKLDDPGTTILKFYFKNKDPLNINIIFHYNYLFCDIIFL